MNFVNETRFVADWTLGFARDGREVIIIAVKATYLFPLDSEVVLSPEQTPLVKADEFTGEPGLSAPVRETDYSHYKPLCDVLLNGSAYAPDGHATNRVTVGLKVADMQKTFDVVGERRWYNSVLGHPRVSAPELFQIQSISYDRAYGGVDVRPDCPDDVRTYVTNPVGCGYYPVTTELESKLLPLTEERGQPAIDVNGSYRPMSFGPIGRSWPTRAKHAGTYDQVWLDNVAPFWPDDFNYRYFQSAPEDQQIPHPKGGEEVRLVNLTPSGFVRFQLPRETFQILLIPYGGSDRWAEVVLDTVLIEPDQQRFMLTWRAFFPLARDVFEVSEIVIGRSPQQRRTELRSGKPYYHGIEELARARRAEG